MKKKSPKNKLLKLKAKLNGQMANLYYLPGIKFKGERVIGILTKAK